MKGSEESGLNYQIYEQYQIVSWTIFVHHTKINFPAKILRKRMLL